VFDEFVVVCYNKGRLREGGVTLMINLIKEVLQLVKYCKAYRMW